MKLDAGAKDRAAETGIREPLLHAFDLKPCPAEGLRMTVWLNSRTLVGPAHATAERATFEWLPDEPKTIEWIGSPSAKCVLKIELPEIGTAAPPQGNGPSPMTSPDLELALEQRLRNKLGMPEFTGDDPSESELGSTGPRG